MLVDIFQLAGWATFGLLITWGIFLSWIGFRSVPDFSRRRMAHIAANISLVVGIAWIMLWVSAVVYNLIEIIGAFQGR